MPSLSHRIAAGLCAAALSVAPFSIASAQQLRIGLAATITSVDPHFHVIGPNGALARHVFDGLFNQDDRQRIVPALVERVETPDPVSWILHLRRDAKFHDGSPLTADDVAATFRRVPTVRGSPSSFLPYVRPVAAIDVIDANTVRMRTSGPFPLLRESVSRIAIVPKRLESADTATFNALRGVVGTGPFKLARYVSGEVVELERAQTTEPSRAPWSRVSLRIMRNDTARVAALLAGDVDLIEAVPPADLARLRRDQRFAVFCTPSNRVMYLHPDQDRERSPHIAQSDGQPIANPLRDARVREALSLAIDRRALVERIMDGVGEPTGQLVPEGMFGHVPDLATPAPSLERARSLLAEAGFARGFALTFHATNDRYPNDERVAQALAQMFTRIGVTTKVVAVPGAVYFTRASNREYSLIMGGAAAETGEASSVLRPLLATYNPQRGDGSGNRGRFSDSEFDDLLHQALATSDAAEREHLLQEATRLAMRAKGVIPLFFLTHCWAARKPIAYRPRTDGWTLAENSGRGS